MSKKKIAAILAALLAVLGAVHQFLESSPDAPVVAPSAADAGSQ